MLLLPCLQTYLIPTGVFLWVYRHKAARDAAPKAPTKYVLCSTDLCACKSLCHQKLVDIPHIAYCALNLVILLPRLIGGWLGVLGGCHAST